MLSPPLAVQGWHRNESALARELQERAIPPAPDPGRDMLEFCSDRRDDVLRFCHHTRVWLHGGQSSQHERVSGRRSIRSSTGSEP
jgi:hypothetical protein